jgi:hypothetical protein
MEQWWVHHQTKVPSFKHKADKDRVEDLTGRIPLLLRALLEWNGQEFCEIEQDFRLHKDLAAVKLGIHNFADRLRESIAAQNYVSSVHSCRSRSTVLIPFPKILYPGPLRLLIRLGEYDCSEMVRSPVFLA